MTEKSWPFDTTTDFGEDAWRRWGRVLSPDGVHGSYGSTALAVAAAVDGLSINIQAGFASLQAGLYSNDATLNKTNTANGAGSARPDRVILRYDQTANSIVAVVREGTAGGTAPPTLTQATTGQWEIPLARWSRAAGGGIGSLVDERQFLDRSGGLVMADTAVTAAVPLTALVPAPWVGQRVTTLPSAREYRWTGVFWERVDLQPLVDAVDATQGTTSAAVWNSSTPTASFVAPLSGRVKVTVSAYLQAPATFAAAYSARITGPAGFDSTPAEDSPNQAVIGGPSGSRGVSTRSWFVSGMTAGTAYTSTGLHKVSGGSGTFDSRQIIIERA